jgi:hypothetical protein
MDKKAIGDADVPAEALKLLGDDGLNLLTQLINNTVYTKVERGPRISLKLLCLD